MINFYSSSQEIEEKKNYENEEEDDYDEEDYTAVMGEQFISNSSAVAAHVRLWSIIFCNVPIFKHLRRKRTFGDPWEIRTPDPLIRSQMLYPAELRGHIYILCIRSFQIVAKQEKLFLVPKDISSIILLF